eukprot:TRINITY_DN4117_c0_g1_i2.p1 TRINITY_DN4117_c0_g1~~TRINITY_DN4117_c0_g1_i2.p1  ORF type:complete len:277 (+),score=42.37 TRINITY_DN4117_c0_g1_i2:329-1159(+)
MNDDGVVLTRRYSGGGAVYQDLGNTNFTFLCMKDYYDKHKNTQIIINGLKKLQINATASGRNDLLVDGKKISGSAYKLSSNRALHHGTILIDINMESLTKYLNPDKAKLLSKGISSVSSRVINLKDIDKEISHEKVCDAITESFFETYKDRCIIEYLDHNFLKENQMLTKIYSELSHWDWRYGKTPEFNHHMEHRFKWGNLDVHIDVVKGRIVNVEIFSDSLYPHLIDAIIDCLKDKTYDVQGVERAMFEVQERVGINQEVNDIIKESSDWLKENL